MWGMYRVVGIRSGSWFLGIAEWSSRPLAGRAFSTRWDRNCTGTLFDLAVLCRIDAVYHPNGTACSARRMIARVALAP